MLDVCVCEVRGTSDIVGVQENLAAGVETGLVEMWPVRSLFQIRRLRISTRIPPSWPNSCAALQCFHAEGSCERSDKERGDNCQVLSKDRPLSR